jgi:hypothetical protein
MRALTLLSLTLGAEDPAAAHRWWSEQLELPAAEDDVESLELGDVVLRFGPATELRVVSYDVEEPTTLRDPGGVGVVVVPPDREAAARSEESIRSFVDAAGELAGPDVAAVANEVAGIALEAHQRIRELVSDLPNDKRLAVFLELGQRARAADVGGSWHLHAASTLMSDTFGPDAVQS